MSSGRRFARALLAELLAAKASLATAARLPVLTPATYPARYCECGTCAVCRHLASSVETPEPRTTSGERAYRWPSLAAALLAWRTAQLDGYPVGSLGGALAALAELGGWTTTERRDSSSASRMAEDAADVERSLWRIEPTPLLSVAAHRDILISRVIGVPTRVKHRDGRVMRPWLPVSEHELADRYGVSVAVVRAATRRAAKAVRDDLVRRGLIPELHRTPR